MSHVHLTPPPVQPDRVLQTNREEEDPLIGQVIDGRYRLDTMLARGAMGRVYVATQHPLGRKVAVKVLDVKGKNADTAVFEERFLREAAVLARLQHPNTVRVYDYGKWEGRTFLVMEYVDGFSLRRLSAGGPIPPQRLVHIAMQICDALQEAHSLGLIHRDLKPANLLITRHAGALDVVKVVDFGLAKNFHGTTELTQAGQVLGTPMYMAPEQIRDETVDHRIDIYALGVLMYRALTGVTPFEKGPAMAVLMAHLKEKPKAFCMVDPDLDLPPSLEWVVFRCLEKDPKDRFASVAELRKALDACQMALSHRKLRDLSIGFEDGHTVLPEGLSEVTGGSQSLQLDLRDDDDQDEEGVPWLETLPARGIAALIALVATSSLILGAALQRLLT